MNLIAQIFWPSIALVLLVLVTFLLLTLCFVAFRINVLLSKLAKNQENTDDSNHPLVRSEISSFLDNLQDAIEDGEENDEYSEIQINPGKFQVLRGRLKGICRRLDGFSKGYLLSSLVHSGMANNPFNLEELDLSGALCSDEIFFGADLSRMVGRGVVFRNAILSEARLENAKISQADLQGARLDEARLNGAYLNEANLNGVYLKAADLSRAYLIGATLCGAYLGEAKLEGAIIRQADLSGADLHGCNLYATTLSESNLNRVILRDAHLQGATLRETSLVRALLTDADLDSADLWRADLTGAILLGTVFQSAYLAEAKFCGLYRDILEGIGAADLERLQEKGTFGLYNSAPDPRFGLDKATSFYKSSWWLASFDEQALVSLGAYLIERFPAPNGLELTAEESAAYQAFLDNFKLKQG